MQTKVCSKCKETKPISEFNKLSSAKDGHRYQCRECQNIQGREYHRSHKEEEYIYSKEYRIKNIDKIKEKDRRNKDRNNKYKYDYVKRNPEKRKEQSSRYYHTHKDEIKERNKINRIERNARHVEYMKDNPNARIAHNYRTVVNRALKTPSYKGRTVDLLGCTVDFFREYLESKWEVNMSWQNYGRGINKWSIDHIVVLDSFDLSQWEQAKIAFHYTNCQPMWYSENSSKSNRYNGKYIKK